MGEETAVKPSLDAAIGKAVETAVASPDKGQGAAAPEKPQVDSGASNGDTGQAGETGAQTGSKAPAKKESPVWNGDVNSLPPELQEHAKAVQRYVTKQSTEAAEARKRVEELEKQRLSDEDRQRFNEWKNQQQAAAKKNQEPSITKEEWEDALLDTTGQKVNALMRRQARWEAEQIRNEYVSQAQKQEAAKQQFAKFEQQVLEFAELNPDFEKYARMGIMLPIAQDELGKGGTLESALARARKLEADLKAERDTELQALADKKKSAMSVDGHGPVEDGGVVWVDSREEALERQIEASMNNKKISVKVRPARKG